VLQCARVYNTLQHTLPLLPDSFTVNEASRMCHVCVCSSLLQCIAVCCSVLYCVCIVLQCVAVCCSVLPCVCILLQCVAVCCSVLQCVAVCLHCVAVHWSMLQCVAVCIHCVAVCCSMSALCSSVLQSSDGITFNHSSRIFLAVCVCSVCVSATYYNTMQPSATHYNTLPTKTVTSMFRWFIYVHAHIYTYAHTQRESD